MTTGTTDLLGSPDLYVDSLMACQPTEVWKWDKACHLFVKPGDLWRLHEFAQLIGLDRKWFQPAKISTDGLSVMRTLPHYDLTEARRKRAIRLGAISVERAFVVETMNQWRAALLASN